MKVGILINEFESLEPTQATAMMAVEAHALGNAVGVFGLRDVGASSVAGANAKVRTLNVASSTEEAVESLGGMRPASVDLAEFDAILIRTNRGRFASALLHDEVLQLLAFEKARSGLEVWNDPAGLLACGSKGLLSCLPPECIPQTVFAQSPEELINFVETLDGPAVLKPMTGTRGENVFKVEAKSNNLQEVVDTVLEKGIAIGQAFVPEAVEGDTRVVVLDGEPLTIEGEACAIRRIPAADDFRSNIHVGGSAAPGALSPGMVRVVKEVAPILDRFGIRLCGLDFLGDLICEVNVHATGGYRDAEAFSGKPFVRRTLERLLGRQLTSQTPT